MPIAVRASRRRAPMKAYRQDFHAIECSPLSADGDVSEGLLATLTTLSTSPPVGLDAADRTAKHKGCRTSRWEQSAVQAGGSYHAAGTSLAAGGGAVRHGSWADSSVAIEPPSAGRWPRWCPPPAPRCTRCRGQKSSPPAVHRAVQAGRRDRGAAAAAPR